MSRQHPDLQPLDSSALAAFHHDADRQRLTVQFREPDGSPGDIWEYSGVGVDKAHTLEHSASAGRYFATHIKGLHQGHKVG